MSTTKNETNMTNVAPMMPIAIDRERVASALKVAGRLKSDTLPILNGRKLSLREGRLIVSATDLDAFLEIGAGMVDEGEWGATDAVVLPGGVLTAAMAAMGSQTTKRVGVFASAKEVRLECGHAKVRLGVFEPEEFPPVPEGEAVKVSRLPALRLWQGIKGTLFCVSKDDARYVLNGVHLEHSADTLTFVATDGRMLATVAHDAEVSLEGASCILPTESAKVLLAALEWQLDLDDGAEIALETSGNQIVFRGPGFTLWSKTVEGNFPNWRQVVPATQEKPYERLTVRRKALLECLSLATCVVNGEKPVVLSVTENGLQLDAAQAEIGNAQDVLPLDFTHPRKSIGPVALNAGYLRAALEALPLGAEDGELCLAGQTDPVTLECGTWKCVVMPMRVN